MIYLGIGSNLSSSFGNRFTNINSAISYLQQKQINLIKKSSFYETFSYPNREYPKFINIVVEVTTSLPAKNLMKELILIEEKLERKRLKKNDPRTCDIDIIDYDQKKLKIKKPLNLTIPHPFIEHRNFVLLPLFEIAKNWKHPVSKVKIAKLISFLKEEDLRSIKQI